MNKYFRLNKEDLEKDPSGLHEASKESFECTEKLKDCVLKTVINGLTYVLLGVRDQNQNRVYSPNEAEIELWESVFIGKLTYTQDEINAKLANSVEQLDF